MTEAQKEREILHNKINDLRSRADKQWGISIALWAMISIFGLFFAIRISDKLDIVMENRENIAVEKQRVDGIESNLKEVKNDIAILKAR